MEAYYDGVLALGKRILRLIALSLELPEGWFEECFTKHTAVLRLLHYSARLSIPEEASVEEPFYSKGLMVLIYRAPESLR